jgi:CO dehydrogenase maturation factor
MVNKIIGFSGKGGVGKTTITTLFLKYLINNHHGLEVLVIDADPDSNIADLLGMDISFKETIGGITTELKHKIDNRELSPDISKNQLLEAEIFDSLIEVNNFDLLIMGRTEGEGCYCYINSILKHIIDGISKNYDLTILDMPAGLEHFARKTSEDVDELVVVTDASKMSFQTLDRIIELTDELELDFKNLWVIGNRFIDGLKHLLEAEITKINRKNVKLLGFIPEDEQISEFNFLGNSLLDLPDNNKAYKDFCNIIDKVLN